MSHHVRHDSSCSSKRSALFSVCVCVYSCVGKHLLKHRSVLKQLFKMEGTIDEPTQAKTTKKVLCYSDLIEKYLIKLISF